VNVIDRLIRQRERDLDELHHELRMAEEDLAALLADELNDRLEEKADLEATIASLTASIASYEDDQRDLYRQQREEYESASDPLNRADYRYHSQD
jgi:chromosome segregation ATPase